MIRTPLYLDEEMHRRLMAAAEKQGRTVSDLVRQALERAYGASQIDDRLTTLDGVASIWRGRADLDATDAYVRRLRSGTRRNPKLE